MIIMKILIKSSFSSIDDKLILWTAKKAEVSPAKNLAVYHRLSDEFLMYAKKGPKSDPWGTTANTSDHEGDWPFNKTLCNLFVFLSVFKYSQCISVMDQYS